MEAKKITHELTDLYTPIQAIVLKRHIYKREEDEFYVEAYDFDKNGKPINAHPLSTREAVALSKLLYNANADKTAFLKPTGFVPENVLHIDPTPDAGKVLWYTPAQERKLYFSDKLEIPCGTAHVPALVWRASKKGLLLFAIADTEKPTPSTKLYQAPFFNVYESGGVCMGSVDVKIKKSMSLEAFIEAWEGYFFNSYFSHTIKESPIQGNIVLFWKNMVQTKTPFPIDVLKPTPYTLNQLLK